MAATWTATTGRMPGRDSRHCALPGAKREEGWYVGYRDNAWLDAEHARLRAAVVDAAMAERKAWVDLCKARSDDPLESRWVDAQAAYGASVDALLAFLGEGKDGEE